MWRSWGGFRLGGDRPLWCSMSWRFERCTVNLGLFYKQPTTFRAGSEAKVYARHVKWQVMYSGTTQELFSTLPRFSSWEP